MRRNNQDYSITEEKYEIIKKHIEKIDKIKNDLQKHINFEIPEYIIHDIAENEEFNHICLIINVAIVNVNLFIYIHSIFAFDAESFISSCIFL